MREQFKEGQRVASVGCYGPADTEFPGEYWDMEIVLEKGELDFMPWVRAVNKKTGDVVMLNAAKCACIRLLPRIDSETTR